MRRSDKRGWIRVVEAVIALLLVTGVLLFVINKGYIGNSDVSPKVYRDQIAILRSIQLDHDLRELILSNAWENNELKQTSWNAFPQEVRDKIGEKTPSYLKCTAKLCELDKVCVLSSTETPEGIEEIYSQAVAISAEGNTYDPRQLKLFCWNG